MKLRKKLSKIVLVQSLACAAILANGIYSKNAAYADGNVTDRNTGVHQENKQNISHKAERLCQRILEIKDLDVQKLEIEWGKAFGCRMPKELKTSIEEKDAHKIKNSINNLRPICIDFLDSIITDYVNEIRSDIGTSELNSKEMYITPAINQEEMERSKKARDEKKLFEGTRPLDKSPEGEEAGGKAEISQEERTINLSQNSVVEVPIEGIIDAKVIPSERFYEGLQIPKKSIMIDKDRDEVNVKTKDEKTCVVEEIYKSFGIISRHGENEFKPNEILVLNINSRVKNLNIERESWQAPIYVNLGPNSSIDNLTTKGNNIYIRVGKEFPEIAKGINLSPGTKVTTKSLQELLTEYKNSIYSSPEARSAIVYVERYNWNEAPKKNKKFDEVVVKTESPEIREVDGKLEVKGGKTTLTTVEGRGTRKIVYINHTYVAYDKEVTDSKDVDPNKMTCINFNGKNPTRKAILDTEVITFVEIEEDAKIEELCIAEGNDNVVIIVIGRALKDAINKVDIPQNFRGRIIENADNKAKEILISAFKSNIFTAPVTVAADKENGVLYISSGSIFGKAAIKITTLEGEQELIVNNYPTLYASQILVQEGQNCLNTIGLKQIKLNGQPGYVVEKLEDFHCENTNNLFLLKEDGGYALATAYKGESPNLVHAKLDLLVKSYGGLTYKVKVPVDILEVPRYGIATLVEVDKGEETIIRSEGGRTTISTKEAVMRHLRQTTFIPVSDKAGGFLGNVKAGNKESIYINVTGDQSLLDIDARNHKGVIWLYVQAGVKIGKLIVKDDGNVIISYGPGVEVVSKDITDQVEEIVKKYDDKRFLLVDTHRNMLRKDYTPVTIPLVNIPVTVPTGLITPFETIIRIPFSLFSEIHTHLKCWPGVDTTNYEMFNIWANEMTDPAFKAVRFYIECKMFKNACPYLQMGVIAAVNTGL